MIAFLPAAETQLLELLIVGSMNLTGVAACTAFQQYMQQLAHDSVVVIYVVLTDGPFAHLKTHYCA
jgi:hypothetical protein